MTGRASILTTNPQATELHLAGLRAAEAHNYPDAHGLFGEARQALGELTTLDAVVQSAHISQDEGWADTWAAIQAPSTQDRRVLFSQARTTLGRSIEATAPYVSGMAFADTTLSQPHGTPKAARQELNTRRGAEPAGAHHNSARGPAGG